MDLRGLPLTLCVSSLCVLAGCTEEGDGGEGLIDTGLSSDTDTGDGDGDPGDGDGDGGDGDPGDGDGDPGDGDGDGDGDPGDGDGDGDTGQNAACMGPVAPAGVLELGQGVSHWAGFTTTGEDWDYCELEGTPFLLIISGAWCPPCQDLAAGMAGQPSSWGTDLDPIRAGLEAGTLEVVEVLVDNFVDYGATSLEDLHQWESMYPNEHVRLLGDPTPGQDGQEPLWIYLGPVHGGSLPAAILVDAEFEVEVMGLGEAVATASAKYGG